MQKVGKGNELSPNFIFKNFKFMKQILKTLEDSSVIFSTEENIDDPSVYGVAMVPLSLVKKLLKESIQPTSDKIRELLISQAVDGEFDQCDMNGYDMEPIKKILKS